VDRHLKVDYINDTVEIVLFSGKEISTFAGEVITNGAYQKITYRISASGNPTSVRVLCENVEELTHHDVDDRPCVVTATTEMSCDATHYFVESKVVATRGSDVIAQRLDKQAAIARDFT